VKNDQIMMINKYKKYQSDIYIYMAVEIKTSFIRNSKIYLLSMF